jgi:hypothetical protein
LKRRAGESDDEGVKKARITGGEEPNQDEWSGIS